MSTMKLKKFDIFLVDFPFTDLTRKKRPVLVIKSFEGDNSILCQITTKGRVFHKYEISLAKEEFSGDIRFDSFVYLDMIFTLHKNLIHRKIGKISESQTKGLIGNKIKTIFIEN